MPLLYLSLDQAATKLAKERGARKAERTKARMESALAASMATPQPLSLHSDDSAKPSLIGQPSTSSSNFLDIALTRLLGAALTATA